MFTHAQNQSKRHNRDNDQQEGQEAVTKFDNAVNTHLGGVYERVFGASGPGGAAQTAGGEANRATSDDNQRLNNQSYPRCDTDLAVNRGGEPVDKCSHDGNNPLVNSCCSLRKNLFTLSLPMK